MNATSPELANIMQYYGFSADQEAQVAAILAQDDFDTVADEIANLFLKTYLL